MSMPNDAPIIDLMLSLPILDAGYFPMGLSLERIMTEMRDVPFRDKLWPKFLYENACKVLKIDD